MSRKIEIILESGKYHYTYKEGRQYITRYGEPWRTETGDNFLLAMAERISYLENSVKALCESTGYSSDDFL